MLVTEKGRWQAASFLWLLCGCTSCLAVSSNAGVGGRMGHGPAVARLRGGDGDIREIAGVSFTVDARPAPGNPFHLAFPVHDLDAARTFWGGVLKCKQGRELAGKWVDFSLYGHQIVCHWVGNDYKAQEYYNPVDGDEVPVPHFGIVLSHDQFHELAKQVEQAGITFIIPPQLRFKGQPGEQWTMFFKDPSNNALEFKAMANPDFLFARYNVQTK